MKLKHIKYQCECEYEELFVDNECVLGGDYYHDKISFQIMSFIKTLNFLKIDYNLIVEEKEKCDNCY